MGSVNIIRSDPFRYQLALRTPGIKPLSAKFRKQIRQIADSITEFGFTNPVLIDRDNTILAGHGRVEAAKLLGRPTVPCLRVEADQQSKFDVLQSRKHLVPPCGRALPARRQVAALRIEARKAKTHRHDRDPRVVVERVLVHTRPIPQTVAGRMVTQTKSGD